VVLVRDDVTKSTHSGERPVTADERSLARWMLEHGSSDAPTFLSGGLRVLGDFLYGPAGNLRGAFIFEQSGVLAGIEVWGLDVPNPPTLPSPGELRPCQENDGQ